MKLASTPQNAEERFDRITRLAKHLFEVPIAQVSLVDKDQEGFKSGQELSITERPRDISFCGHALLSSDTFVIPDTLLDERFTDNPMVLGEPKIRFYAGHPLTAPNGSPVGMLCVKDHRPRQFSPEDLQALKDLAALVESELSHVDPAPELAGAKQHKQVEEDLLKFKLGIEHSNDAVFLTDPNGVIIYINPAFEKVYGFTREEAIGQTPRILKSGLIPPERYEGFWKTLLAKGSVAGEIVNKTKDGRLTYVAANNNPILDEQENIIGFLAVHHDITTQKQAEEALRASEARNRNLLQALPDMIIRYHGDGTYLDIKPSKEFRAFRDPADLIGRNLFDVVPPDVAQKRMQYIQLALQTGQIQTYEHSFSREDQTKFEEIAVVPIEAADEVFVIIRDITERKQDEEALARRVAELQMVARVSTATSTILETDKLLQEVVDLTKSSFDLYHAHVYLLNQAEDTLMLMAGAGEVGRRMVSAGWSIPLNRERSLVAQAARTRRGLLVNDVRKEPDFLPNPLLPETRAEMAVPLIVGEQLLGVLDVQADVVGRFTEEDLRIQITLAGQVAVALQNARSFAEQQKTQQMLQERVKELNCLNEIGREIVESPAVPELLSWTTERIPLAMFYPDLCQVAIEYEGQIYGQPQAIELPCQMTHALRIGGEVMGRVYISYTEKREFLNEESALLGGVASRLSGYIESRGLLEQVQDALAVQEHLSIELDSQRRTLQAVLDNIPVGVFVVEAPSGKPLLANEQVKQLLGRGVALDVNKKETAEIYATYRYGTDLLYPPDQTPLARGLLGEMTAIDDMEVHQPHGRRVLLQVVGAPIRDAQGSVSASVAIFQDITERKQAEEELSKRTAELEESQAFLDSIIENLPVMLFIKEAKELRHVRWNKTGLELLGRKAEEMIGKNDYDFFSKEEADFFAAKDREALAKGELVEIPEETIESKDKGTRWLYTRKTPIYGADGQPKYLLGISVDITQRKQIEETFKESEERFRVIAETSPVPILISSISEGLILYGNEQLGQTFGLAVSKLIGQQTPDFYYNPADRMALLAALKRDGRLNDYELHVKKADGTPFWVLVSMQPLVFAGQPAMLAAFYDITERKRTEEALRRSQEQLSGALETAKLAYWEADMVNMVFTLNDQFYSLLRTTAQQEGGYLMPVMQYAQRFVHPEDASAVGAAIQKSIETTDPNYSGWAEHRIIRADGSEGYIVVRFRVIKDEQGRTVKTIGANQDITERKQAEEVLRRSQEQLSEALTTAKLAYWELDVATRTFTFNDQFYSQFYTTAEQEGGYLMPAMDYARKFVHPDDVYIVGSEIQKSLEMPDPNYSPPELEHRIIRADGSEGYVVVRVRIMRDEQGRAIKTFGANQDITERKQAELERERLLAEVEAAYRRYVRGEWKQFLGEQHHGEMRIEHQTVDHLALNFEPSRLDANLAGLQDEVIAQGKTKVVADTKANGQGTEPTIVTPIMVRGQTIGTLSLQDLVPDRQWSTEEVALVETVSEQLALTLENLRLFEDTQKQATREQLTREITDKMRAAPDMNTIIQTGLAELAKALNVSRAYVKLATKPEDD